MDLFDSLTSVRWKVLSVYESGAEQLRSYGSKEDVPFFLIADPEEKLYDLFKVKKSWWRAARGRLTDYKRKHKSGKQLFKSEYNRDGSLRRIGADFLIDENGFLKVAYYGKYAGDHLPADSILKWMRLELK